MCNLYSVTKGQAAIRDLFRAKHDRAGNLPLFPAIFPHYAHTYIFPRWLAAGNYFAFDN